MADFELSTHAKDMLRERNIREEWVWRTLDNPDNRRIGADQNMHYTKAINEFDMRILRVVVNQNASPNRIVTIFFDRRLSKKAGN
jgi:hypothetical protein